MQKTERRKLERLNLQLAGTITPESNEASRAIFEVKTRDISSGGVFVLTSNRIPAGAKAKIELFFEIGKSKGGADIHHAAIKTSGKVLRTEATGMAFYFDPQYEIRPLS